MIILTAFAKTTFTARLSLQQSPKIFDHAATAESGPAWKDSILPHLG
jgi:hypothetical protein